MLVFTNVRTRGLSNRETRYLDVVSSKPFIVRILKMKLLHLYLHLQKEKCQLIH